MPSCVLFLIFLRLLPIQSSEIVFSSSDMTFKPVLTKNLHISCMLRDTNNSGSIIIGRSLEKYAQQATASGTNRSPRSNTVTQTKDNVDFVTSIVISRGGVDLATITEHIPATSLINQPDFHVSGNLTGAPGVRGYLEITWRQPTVQVSGEYRCEVDTVNNQGHSFDFSDSLELQDQELSFNDVIAHLHTMEVEREEMERRQNETRETMQSFNQTLEQLKVDNSQLRQSLHDLKNQSCSSSSSQVFFTSVLTWDKVYAEGQTVLYDGVLVNQGGGYDSSTGVFTCPLAGFYHFNVNAVSENSKNFDLELRHNAQYLVSVLSIFGNGYQASSNSATVKLAQNDTVQVVAVLQAGSYLHGNSQQHESLSTFSGRRISDL